MFCVLCDCKITIKALYRCVPILHSFVMYMQCVYILQVNKKFCELKGGHIGIVEKAQETRFGMFPKYSRYIGIAS